MQTIIVLLGFLIIKTIVLEHSRFNIIWIQEKRVKVLQVAD